jgi:cytochrome c
MLRSIFSWFLGLIVAMLIVVGVALISGNKLVGDFVGQAEASKSGIVSAVYGSSNESYQFKSIEPVQNAALKGCVVCHSLEKNGSYRVAPGLWGIVGADKARAGWYGYSHSLRTAGGTWTEADLDKYFTNPGGFLPGTKKTMHGIASAEKRKALIAALQQLSD